MKEDKDAITGFRKFIARIINGKNILLLGLGMEGMSTYRYLRKISPGIILTLADDADPLVNNPDLKYDKHNNLLINGQYKNSLTDFDIIIKSPGFPLNGSGINILNITSQTDLFLRYFHKQVIGITGTKGKSTTASLVHNILKNAGKDSFLAGNIGVPVFDIADRVTADSIIVFELSAHQLEYIIKSPYIAVLLNIYQDHLDHFGSFNDYGRAKLNILENQDTGSYVILNADQPLTGKPVIPEGIGITFFSGESKPLNGAFGNKNTIDFYEDGRATTFDISNRHSLFGRHNLENVMAAICCSRILKIDKSIVENSIRAFRGLPHRMEFAGKYRGIKFYNDAIATIPEACIHAIIALGNVETLILGGKDRGISYDELVAYIKDSGIKNLLLTGNAGQRIYGMMGKSWCRKKNCYLLSNFSDFFDIAVSHTSPGKICLLSPAAPSYDEFRNFEEKGSFYKKIISDAHGQR